MDEHLTLKKERLLTFYLSLIQFTAIMDFVIMMPLGPQFMRVFSIGPSEFSLMVSAYTFSAGFFGIIGALFIDQFGRKRALLFLYFGFTISTLFCALAPDHRLFILARIFAGAFGGPLGAIVFSIIGDKIPEKRRGAATGKVMSAFAMASILGIPFGLKLANAWSWRAPFFLLTGLSIILFLIGARTLPTMIDHIRKMHRRNHIRETLSILIKPNHVRAYVLSGMLLIGSFSVIPFISPYMVSNAGFLESNLMYIYLIGGSVTFFTAPLIGKLSDIFGKYRMFSIMAIISVAPILMVTHLNETADWIVIVSTTFFMICSSGRMVPATALVTSSALPHERGGFMSINSSVQQFAAGIATYFAGHIIQKTSSGKMLNYDWVGYIAIITTLLCLWLARRVRPAAGIRNLVDAKDIAGVSSEI